MSSMRRLQLLRRLCLASIATFNAVTPLAVIAADAPSHTANATKLDTVEVTGSRLQRVDIEGPLPIVVITREQIEQSGEISISAVLRGQIFNSFGSFTPTSGTGATQGAAQVNLRGLGPERTLVLIDGRRIPNNPAFGGASQNINNIPMTLVERIEILREGASAIYGSDAIGGVINIITKHDYNGMQFSTQLDRPSIKGGDAETAALIGGFSNDKSQGYFALEHYNKDIINGRDVKVIRDLAGASGYPGTIYQYDADGNVVAQTSNLDASGNPLNFRPFDNCPNTGFGTNADFPYSNIIGGRCRYLTGSVIALTTALKRQSLTLGGSYTLPLAMTGFTRVALIRAESFGRFAAAPADAVVDGINSPDANGNIGIRLAPDNPNNPNPGSTLILNYRPTVLGTRDETVKDHIYQFLLGIKGNVDWHGFTNWELAASYDTYQQNSIGLNNGLVRELQTAVDEGRFNPFAPDANVADEFRHTTTRDNHFNSKSIDGKLNYELKLADISVPIAFGAEYHNDDFAVISDTQSTQAVFFATDGTVSGFRQSNVFGSVGGSASGVRSSVAAFVETAVHLYDNKLELGFALRFDRANDIGNALSQKWSIGYRPLNNTLLRASFGEGFRAPGLASLYGAPAKATSLIIDRLSCRENPSDSDACSGTPRTTIFDSNPKLDAEKSENWSVGWVWDPIPRLSLALDYYAIKVNNAITQLAPQTVYDNELRCADQGRHCDARKEGYVVRTEANSLLFAYSPAINAAKLKTTGIDLSANYQSDRYRHGRYTANASIARTLSYKRQNAPDAPLLERLDTLNANSEIFPKFRAHAMLNWKLGAFDSTLAAKYISNVTDCDAPDKLADNPACNNKFDDYLSIDLQFGVDTPWKQRIAVGVRNLFNEAPKVSRYGSSVSVPGIFYALHDSDQRVLFLRFVQDF